MLSCWCQGTAVLGHPPGGHRVSGHKPSAQLEVSGEWDGSVFGPAGGQRDHSALGSWLTELGREDRLWNAGL